MISGAVGRALGRGETGGGAWATVATGAQEAAVATPATIKLRVLAVPATPARTVQYPKLETPATIPRAEGAKTIEVPVDVSRPASVLRPSMVKHAGVEAGLKKQVAESVREIQELGPGVVATLEGFEKAKQVEEQVKQELVKPRWESIKAFTRDLAGLSWRQLKTNMRAYGSEFYQGIRYLAERELGAKLPEKLSLSFRGMKRERFNAPGNKIVMRRVMRDFMMQPF